MAWVTCLDAVIAAAPPHPSRLGLSPPYFTVREGEPVPRPVDDMQERRCTRYLFLGSGLSGIVHRLRVGSGPEQTVVTRKQFRDSSVRNDDYWLMQRYFDAQQAGLDVGFRIPRTWIDDRGPHNAFTGDRYIYFENIEGAELARILLDPAVDSRVKAWLEYTYRRRLTRWRRFVRARWQGSETEVASYMAYFDGLRRQLLSEPAETVGHYALRFAYQWFRVELNHSYVGGGETFYSGTVLMKADSIIVDPWTLRMYLVDPQ